MGITGSIKEILVSLSKFFMQPIAELFLKLAVTVALYRKKYTK